MHTSDCTKLFFNYFGNSSTIIYLSDECLLWNHKTWILYHCSFRRNWFRNEHFTQFQSLYSDRTSKKVCIWCRKNTFQSWISYHFFCYWDDYQFFEISLPPIFRLVRKINKYVFFTIYLKHDICFSFFFVTWFFFIKNEYSLIVSKMPSLWSFYLRWCAELCCSADPKWNSLEWVSTQKNVLCSMWSQLH